MPDFWAKNQTSGSAPVLFFNPWSYILCPDDEDRLFCPVRALRWYLNRSRTLRSLSQRRLFISVNPGYNKDISKVTLARWLVQTVLYVFIGLVSLKFSSSRAHEIRAWVASLAWAHLVSLSALLDTAYWRSQGTFIEFYLRDISRLRTDGSRGISSLVVAQHAIVAAAGTLH